MDLAQPQEVLRELDHALASFEKGAPLPVRAQQALLEIDDALADCGPMELGVSSASYFRTVSAVQEAINSLRDGTERHEPATTLAKRALAMARVMVKDAAKDAPSIARCASLVGSATMIHKSAIAAPEKGDRHASERQPPRARQPAVLLTAGVVHAALRS